MINSNGEIVYDSEFNSRPTASYNGIFSVEEGNGYTVYKIGSKSPEAVSGLEGLKDAGYFEEGLIPVTFPGKRISLADADGKIKVELNPIKGKEVISCASGFSEGMLKVCTEDGKYGYVNKMGEVIIQPQYDLARSFSQGVAIVANVKEDGGRGMVYSVIDKSGNVVFKFKDSYVVESYLYRYGYILACRDGRYYMFDRNGEEIKLPSKVKMVTESTDRYIIFQDEKGEYGLLDINGEIVIRPKYYKMAFGNGGFVLAKKDFDDKEIVKIDFNGEESKECIDYEELYVCGRFGYLAMDDEIWALLNDNFEKKGKEEFYEFNLNWYNSNGNSVELSSVNTDYFDPASAANAMADMIEGDRVGYLKLGNSAEEILGNSHTPTDYVYTTYVELSDLKKDGFRYEIDVKGEFSDNTTDCGTDSWGWSVNYFWNPESKLIKIHLNLSARSEWGGSGREAIKTALLNAGYNLESEEKPTSANNMYSAIFKKDDILVSVVSELNSNNAHVTISKERTQPMVYTEDYDDYNNYVDEIGCDIDYSDY